MSGMPVGAVEAVLSILRASPEPLRRRKLLAALEARGHRISLAGLNRVLEYCAQNHWVSTNKEGAVFAS